MRKSFQAAIILLIFFSGLNLSAQANIEKTFLNLTISSSNLGVNLNASNIDGSGNTADSSDTNATWVNLANNSSSATLNNFSLPSTSNSGWDGNNSASNPCVLKFDGTNDYAGFSATGLNNDSYTFETWVKISSLPSASNVHGLLSIGDGTAEQTIGIANDFLGQSGFYILSNYSGGINFTSQNFSPTTNIWYHLVGVRNTSDSTLKLYVNGNEVASTTLTSSSANYGTSTVGRVGVKASNSGFFNGVLGNSRIYKSALSASTILQNYLSEAYKYQGVDNVSPGLKADKDFLGVNFKKAGDTFELLAEDVNPTANGDNDISAISSINCTLGSTVLALPAIQELNFSSGLTFDGVDDYVILNPIPNFPQDQITAALWVKTGTSGQGILSYASNTSDNDFLIYRAGNLNIFVRGNSISTGVSINDNKWHYLVVTWKSSNGELKLYKDSILSYSTTVASGQNITPGGALVLGQDQNAVGGDFDSSQAFKGQINNVQIYKRVLTQDEIISNYKFPYEISNPQGIISSWKLDDNSLNSSSVTTAQGKKWSTTSNTLAVDNSLVATLTNFNFNRNSGWVNQYSYNLGKYIFTIPTLSGSNQVEKLSCSISDFSGNTSSNSELGGVFVSRAVPLITSTVVNSATLKSGDSFTITVSDNTPDVSILQNPTTISASIDGNAFSQTCSIIPSNLSKALNFDGTDDFIDAGNQTKLRDISQKTISFWVKLRSQAPFGQSSSYFITKGDAWYIATDPSNSRNIFVQNFSNNNGKWSFPQFSINSWHHIVVAYDRQSASNSPDIYIDGSLQNINKISTPSGSASSDASFNLKIGKSELNNGFLEGIVDDIQVYSRLLSQEEINRLNAIPGRIINALSLVSWWRFDKLEDTDSNNILENVRDYSGNSNHGTLSFGSSLPNALVDSDLSNSLDGRTGSCTISISQTNPTGPSDVTNKTLSLFATNNISKTGTESKTISLSRNRAPLAPVISQATVNGVDIGTTQPFVVKEGQVLNINFSGSDSDSQDMITLSTPVLSQLGVFNIGSTNNPGTGNFIVTPNQSHVGKSFTFSVRSTDNYLQNSASDLTISFLVVANTQAATPTPSPTASSSASATPIPTPTSSATPNSSATPQATSTPSGGSSGSITNINLDSLTEVTASFPSFPTTLTGSFGLDSASASNIKNIIITGSPASFIVNGKSSAINNILNQLAISSNPTIKLVDSKKMEFTIPVSVSVNSGNPAEYILQTASIPGTVAGGNGSIVLVNNNDPSGKIGVYVLKPQALSIDEIEKFKPVIDSVVVIRKPKIIKFVVAGDNFFRKKIIVGTKEITTKNLQTSVAVTPNDNLKLFKVYVLPGKKVVVAQYTIVKPILKTPATLRVLNPYGQAFKTVEVPSTVTGAGGHN